MSEASSAIAATLVPLSATAVGGHAYDRERPDRRLALELLIDGFPAALARADLFDPALAKDGRSDGCHGFLFALPPGALADARRLELRLANGDATLARLDAPFVAAAPDNDAEVRWFGGLRLNGWLGGSAGGGRVRALVEGKPVAEAVADGWAHVGEGACARARRAFDLFLPDSLADGRVHHAQVIDEAGRELPGSPVFVIAFADGLAQFIRGRGELDSQRPRAEFFDRLMPQALPFSQAAQARLRTLPPLPETPLAAPVAVVLVGASGVEASIESLESQENCDWLAAAMDSRGGPAGFDPADLAAFLDADAGACEFVAFAPGGTLFQPAALATLAAALKDFPAAPWAYADFTLEGADGGEWPAALPAFDYERLLSQGAGALLFLARRGYVKAALAAGADSLFRLCNFAFDARRAPAPRPGGPRQGFPLASTPAHVPGFLARLPRLDARAQTPALMRAAQAHFDARKVPARIDPAAGFAFPCIRLSRQPAPGKVSILIPTRDRLDLLRPCIDSLFATVDLAAHEIIVLDNDSSDPETLAWFEQMSARGLRVFRVGGAFNFARIVNAGAAVATGQFLLLLNNDVEALHKGWLEDMRGHMAEPDVGAVGAHLLWPSGVVQHGGVVLGPRYAAAHAFNDRMDGDPGYADLLLASHECSSVTAACMLTDRALFNAVGGFDALSFPVNFNDVDYCLKLRAEGLRVVQSPHARLLHRESASRGKDEAPDKAARMDRELRNLRAAWGDVLVADPAYSPLLSLDPLPYSALAWPPRPSGPRQPGFPRKRVVPAGF
jgi:GT2 family glycosyltransferase